MLEETVTVVRIAGDEAWVEAETRSACGHCGSAGSCGTATIGQLLGTRRHLFAVRNELQTVPGEQVVIGIPDGVLVQASAAAYLLPLLTMAVPAALGDAGGMSGPGVAVLSVAGFVLGLLLAGRIAGRAGGKYRPRMLRRPQTEFSLTQFNQGVLS